MWCFPTLSLQYLIFLLLYIMYFKTNQLLMLWHISFVNWPNYTWYGKYNTNYLREGPGSQPQSTLSLKKLPTVNEKFRPSLNLVPKKPCRSKLSDLLWHLISKCWGLVIRWLCMSTNGIKVHSLGVAAKFKLWLFTA